MVGRMLLIPILAVLIAAPALSERPLAYVERSTGLSQPGLEQGPTELEFGDVNGDGYPDMVSVGDHNNPGTSQNGIMVWFGSAAGTWTFAQSGGGFGYGGVAVADVDGDGLLDVGFGIHHNYPGSGLGSQLLNVALGDGTGQQWTAWSGGLATSGETWGMFGTDFADVDNDGLLDIGSISMGCCAGLHVYRNHGGGTWTHAWGFLGGNSDNQFVFGDINGDGHADFAASHGGGTVYFGDGAGNFALADGGLSLGPWRFGISLGDVTGNGRADLCFRTTSGVHVYSWVAPGQWQNLSGILASLPNVKLTQIADMNLDGFGDVIVLMHGQIGVYTGDGQGNWQLATTISMPAACNSRALRTDTDVDHNGYPDIAVIAEENCHWWPGIGGTNTLRCYAESSIPTEPFIYPKYPRGGETWIAGSVRFIDWHAAVLPGSQPTMTIELSRGGPDGPFVAIATGLTNNGRFQWTVPAGLVSSANCYLRLSLDTEPPAVATTPAPFTIANPNPPAAGDMNCDGLINAFDIDPFVLALTDAAAYAVQYTDCDVLLADINGDGLVNAFDIDPFVILLTGGGD
jgi:hypothetical protein